MYSDIALHIAIKFNELPAEKQILIMQSILIIAEVIAFFLLITGPYHGFCLFHQVSYIIYFFVNLAVGTVFHRINI